MDPTEHDFDNFCRALSPRLIGALVLQFGDHGRAEDVAQEALARAWSQWPSVAAMARPQSWVFTVAFRLAIGGHRRRDAEHRANTRASQRGSESTDDGIEDLVVDRIILEPALRAMSARQRAAIALRYYAGFNVAEAAAIMHCAEGTVKALTSQAIARLRSTVDGTTSETAAPTGGGEPL